MDYETLQERTDAASRFGVLHQGELNVELPAASPAIRTATDAKAVERAMQGGLRPATITPYASRARRLNTHLTRLLAGGGGLVERPLVVADPEAEALNVSCTARTQYQEGGAVHTAIRPLMNTGLTGDARKGRLQTHAAWRQCLRSFGVDPIYRFNAAWQSAVQSDMFLGTGPIVTADPATVDLAFQIAEAQVARARFNQSFSLGGVHLLVHQNVLKDGAAGQEARNRIIDQVARWESKRIDGTGLSIKMYDQQNHLQDSGAGQIYRHNLSFLLQEIQALISEQGGLLTVHNMANWVVGALDSGSDIATFRVDGKTGIEVPMRSSGKSGPREPARMTLYRTLATAGADVLKPQFERQGAFPVPECMKPEPWWDYTWSEGAIYAGACTTGSLVEIGQQYRDAGLSPSMPLAESVRGLVADCEVRQDLMDLCPSIN